MKNLAFVIEDNPDISTLFSRAVALAGFCVEPIYDGETAQKKLERESPQLIVLDLHLPNVNGKELLAQIRQKEHLRYTKVIITTADAALGEFHQEKADLLLEKPVSFTQMRDFAERFIVQD